MIRKQRSFLFFAMLGAALLGGLAATVIAPRLVKASPLGAFGPQLKVTVLDVPASAKDVGGEWVKVTDIGAFQTETGSSLVEAAFQGRLFMQAVQGNDVVNYQLRVDDQPAYQGTGQYHLNKKEQNTETPAAFSGYWQGLAAGKHTVSLWARTGSPTGSASGVTADYQNRPDNLVIVKEYLPLGTTYLPSVQR